MVDFSVLNIRWNTGDKIAVACCKGKKKVCDNRATQNISDKYNYKFELYYVNYAYVYKWVCCEINNTKFAYLQLYIMFISYIFYGHIAFYCLLILRHVPINPEK